MIFLAAECCKCWEEIFCFQAFSKTALRKRKDLGLFFEMKSPNRDFFKTRKNEMPLFEELPLFMALCPLFGARCSVPIVRRLLIGASGLETSVFMGLFMRFIDFDNYCNSFDSSLFIECLMRFTDLDSLFSALEEASCDSFILLLPAVVWTLHF